MHHPPVLDSLQAGATDEELAEAEALLGLPLPLPLATIYRCVAFSPVSHGYLFQAIGLSGDSSTCAWNSVSRYPALTAHIISAKTIPE